MTSLPSSLKHRLKAGRKRRVTVMRHKAHHSPFLLQLPHELACLLGHPLSRWPRGAARQMHPPHANLHEEEDRQRFQGQGFHGKEITRQEVLLVLAQEAPGVCPCAVFCWPA